MNVVGEDVVPSRALGFAQLWHVHAGYRISGDVVSADGSIVRAYGPAAHPELPAAVAKLPRGDVAAVQRLVTTFGLLGYGGLIGDQRCGDPLLWVWSHAETLHLCLDLIYASQQLDVSQVRQRLLGLRLPVAHEPMREAETDRLPYCPGAYVAIREGVVPQVWGSDATRAALLLALDADLSEARQTLRRLERDDALVMQLARQIVTSVVNGNIAGIARRVPSGTAGAPGWLFGFSALIELAYWHLADVLDTRQVQRCAGCGAYFLQTHGRQRFCPDFRAKTRTSPCANRQRMRRYLSRHRGMSNDN